jgi:hypothetical protein
MFEIVLYNDTTERLCHICDVAYPVSKHNFEECYSLDPEWDLKRMGKLYSIGSMTARNGYKE